MNSKSDITLQMIAQEALMCLRTELGETRIGPMADVVDVRSQKHYGIELERAPGAPDTSERNGHRYPDLELSLEAFAQKHLLKFAQKMAAELPLGVYFGKWDMEPSRYFDEVRFAEFEGASLKADSIYNINRDSLLIRFSVLHA